MEENHRIHELISYFIRLYLVPIPPYTKPCSMNDLEVGKYRKVSLVIEGKSCNFCIFRQVLCIWCNFTWTMDAWCLDPKFLETKTHTQNQNQNMYIYILLKCMNVMDSDKICEDNIVSYRKYPKYRTTYCADLPKLAKTLWILFKKKTYWASAVRAIFHFSQDILSLKLINSWREYSYTQWFQKKNNKLFNQPIQK